MKEDQRTTLAKEDRSNAKWYLVDAKGQSVGRLAAKISHILQGKNKPTYTPHQDTGDFVVVINAKDLKFTGRKLEQNVFRYHTGYVGGLREVSWADQMKKNPEDIVKHAVARMLPKTKLGKHMFTKLKVYADANHSHGAQNPEALTLS